MLSCAVDGGALGGGMTSSCLAFHSSRRGTLKMCIVALKTT
jgi:hypothetical protein